MPLTTLRIDVSPEQEDVIFLYLTKDEPLGMLPDERQWMIAHVQKKFPGAQIKSAELDLLNGEWILQILTKV
jgi:hypothetical protein